MDLFEAIHQRHSIKKVKQDPVPRGLIEKMLDAAVQAPNHYKVRPWRFVVLTGAGRHRLGDVMAASTAEYHPEYPPEALEKCRATPLQAPLVIAVGVDQHIMGFIYNGYPEFTEQFPPRPSFEDRTVWME